MLVGLVIFLLLLRTWISGSGVFNLQHTLILLVREIGGNRARACFGISLLLMLRTIDSYQMEQMLTLAFVSGGYQLATALHTSGALAISLQ